MPQHVSLLPGTSSFTLSPLGEPWFVLNSVQTWCFMRGFSVSPPLPICRFWCLPHTAIILCTCVFLPHLATSFSWVETVCLVHLWITGSQGNGGHRGDAGWIEASWMSTQVGMGWGAVGGLEAGTVGQTPQASNANTQMCTWLLTMPPLLC